MQRRLPAIAGVKAAWPLTALVCVTAVEVWLLSPILAEHTAAALVQGAIPPLLIIAGIALRSSPSETANGNLFILSGLLWPALYLNWHPSGLYPLAGWILGPIAVVPLAVALLKYPRLSFDLPNERWWAICTPCFLLAGRTVLALFDDPKSEHGWWPNLLNRPALQAAAEVFVNVGSVCLAVAFVVLAGLRFTRLKGLDRTQLRPVAIAGAAAGAAVAVWVVSVAYTPPSDQSPDWVLVVSGLFTIVIPLSFYLAGLQKRIEASAIADLVRDIDRASSPHALQKALRVALCDPDLALFVRLGDGTYLGASGDQTVERTIRDGLEESVHPIVVFGPDTHELAIVYTTVDVERHRQVLDAALAAASLALESASVYASLLLTLDEVTRSRARIVEAAVRERRQVERDLHDGTQQRLLTLSMSLARLRGNIHDEATRAIVEDARDQLREAVAELRRLARGIYPAVLTKGGLCAALENVAERTPIRVDLDLAPVRWPATLETTAYFIACEALTNAIKHGDASRVTIRIRGDHNFLHLVVSDDGCGGAKMHDSGGLAGLRDRVSALGGAIEIGSGEVRGTRLAATIPTESRVGGDLHIATRDQLEQNILPSDPPS